MLKEVTSERPSPQPQRLAAWPNTVFQRIVLAVCFSATALLEAARTTSVWNVEVWQHLRIGHWILENYSVPHSGIFSQYSSVPWVDSSWLFDALTAAFYKLLGLRGIPVLTMILSIGVAWVIFALARAQRANRWTALMLSAAAQFVLVCMQPAPNAISALFFGIELVLLTRYRSSGNPRELYWLLPLFVLWSNLHVQFVLGLFLLALFAIVEGCRVLSTHADAKSSQSLTRLIMIVGGCAICALINPYGIKVFADFMPSMYSAAALEFLEDMGAMSFRRLQDFALMLMVMSAFFALGRKHLKDVFMLVVLIGTTLLAFRIHRDSWAVVITSTAILAGVFSRDASNEKGGAVAYSENLRFMLTAGVTIAILAAAVALMPRNDRLMDKVSEKFPTKACDSIRAKQLPEPLFTPYAWGSFLMWYMPDRPIAIDSRLSLYGEDIALLHFKLINGKARPDSDPTFASARTVLLERDSAMAKAFESLPALSSHYRAVYTDKVSTVFESE